MKKAKKLKSIATLRNQCDRALQEIGRRIGNKCEACGKERSCYHHYFPKSSSSILRYNLKNCIDLCAGCHFSHHNGNPVVHSTVLHKRGREWEEELKLIKKNGDVSFKPTRKYYEELLEKLKKI